MFESRLIKACTAGAAALVVVTAGLTGCSSSASNKSAGDKTPTTSAVAPVPSSVSTPPASAGSSPSVRTASGSPADAATAGAIDKAFVGFFLGSNTFAQRQALLQNGAKLTSVLQDQAKNPTANALSAKVSSVALVNPNVANVIFSLNAGGSPLLANTAGLAVKENGVWKVAAQTFCALAAVAGPAPAQCSDTAITKLPAA